MNESTAEAAKSTADAAKTLFEVLKDEPCLIAIIVVFAICFGIVWVTFWFQSQQSKEQTKQMLSVMRRSDK